MPIAIVGMACRLPGADGLNAYWDLLANGRDLATDMPSHKLDRALYYDPVKGKRGRTYSASGAFITERPLDLTRVPLTAEDLRNSDPCHQILCEVAAEATRHAGLDPFHMPTRPTGVYVGHSGGSPLGGDVSYAALAEETVDFLRDVPAFQSLPHEEQSTVMQQVVAQLRSRRRQRDVQGEPEIGAHGVAGLIARVLKLSGPQMAIDAACASSLVALTLGMLALQQGEIETAIIGGASFNKCDSMILFSHAQSCTADRSRPFDNAADGLLSSEGYVVLVLKTLEQALAEKDRICAVIRSVGISSDGRGKSLWAPRKEGQVTAMQRAYSQEVEAAGVDYVEAHATSTQVGDATEIDALREFFSSVKAEHKLPIGSVKSNIGHTLETAGLAGLLKVVLAMQHGQIPPSINVRELNREIPWEKLPFYVARELRPWPRRKPDLPRRAAVNAFGIGGLNVHVVVDEFDLPVAPSHEAVTYADNDAIAIIGRGVILPSAFSVSTLSQLLQSGRSCLIPAPANRWRPRAGVHAPRGGFIEGYEYDWRKYKIPPKQVAQANPLQFMLLDAARQALEEAGYHAKPFDQTHTAVVVGSAFGAEFGNQLQVGLRLPELSREVVQSLVAQGQTPAQAAQTAAALEETILAAKPALLDETGSFTASTLASRLTKTLDLMGGAMAIDTGDCSSLAALDAACNLLRGGTCSLVLCAGASRAMDYSSYEQLHLRGSLAAEDVPGEGVAVLLLKRLSDAHRDGDKIIGIVRKVAARQSAEASLTEAGYADPLVKQIGHTQSAQGLVSVISATLTQPNAERINIRSCTDRGLEYQAEIIIGSELPAREEKASPIHLSIQERSEVKSEAKYRVVRIGAINREQFLSQLSQVNACWTNSPSAFGSSATYRAAIVASDEASFTTKLDLLRQMFDQPASRIALEEQGIFVATKSSQPARIALLFPGQGSQYPEMLRSLCSFSPAAIAARQQADALLAALTGESFAQLAWGDAQRLGHDVWATQAAMLLADVMLFAALQERGVQPDVVCGHSFGEFAALYAAGSWNLQQALRITQVRAQAINASRSAHGGLLSVETSVDRLSALIQQHRSPVYITHCNAPQQTVVGGDDRSLAEFSALLTAEGLSPRALPVPSAFHTPLLADTQEPLARALAQTELRPPRVPLLSSVSNRYAAEPEDLKRNLVNQMVEPVRYLQLIERLALEGVNVFIEVGPQQVLTRLTRQILAGREVHCLPTDHPKRTAEEMLLRLQAALEVIGATVPNIASPMTNQSTKPSPEISHFDATTRRREQRRTPTKNVPPIATHAPITQFDATLNRRASQKIKHNSPATHPITPSPYHLVTPSPPHPITPSPAPTSPNLERFLIDFVVEQTGYPAEMIDLDWDMEADLGIDSIKRAQLFGELREFFDFEKPGKNGLSLDRFRTLRQVLDFLSDMPGKAEELKAPVHNNKDAKLDIKKNGQAAVIEPSNSQIANRAVEKSTPATTNGHAPANGELEKFLIRFVVEQTGYPPEIVELDADLEADLGIDSIKKAQLFGELREHFELPLERMGKLKIADYHTLRQVMQVLITHLPTTAGNGDEETRRNGDGEIRREREKEIIAPSAEYTRGLELGREQAAVMNTWLRERVDSQPLANWQALNTTATITDEIQGLAAGARISVFNALAYQEHNSTHAPVTLSPCHPFTPSPSLPIIPQHASQATRLSEPTVASRYVLRLTEAPQKPNSPTQPMWHGAAVILGNNPLGQAIKMRFEREGRRAYIITPTQDPLGAAAELERIWQQEPICHLFLVTPRDAAATTTLDAVTWKNNREHGLLSPFWLCQRWLKLVGEAGLMDRASLVATVSLGGDFGLSGNVIAAEGGAIGGLLKAIIIESWVNGHRTTPVKIIDAPVDLSDEQIIEATWRELAVPSYDCEIGLLHGRRHVIRAHKSPLQSTQEPAIRRGEVWVCTGGARGITAYVARELGQRFGLKLQLIGTAPEPNIPTAWRTLDEAGLKELKLQVMQQARADGKNPIKAWQNTEKAMEIDHTLREFASLGIEARYYSCDVADRSALARVLDRVRNEVGPIEGILHGAGVGKDSRFDRKEPEKVEQCFAAKIDGALSLMDLTRRDPIKHFVAFGSISGRFGANGHTDYSAANDMLCKLVDWYRRQRPKTHAVAFHWHAWGDVGMATKPETKLALELVDMQFMPAHEGLQHLLNELAAGTPEGEVLITDDRYHRMFYPAETLSSDSSASKYPLLDAGSAENQGAKQISRVELDPLVEPFLAEHRLEDRPLLPVVIGMEMLAEAAARVANGRVIVLHHVAAVNGLRYFQDRSQTVNVISEAKGSQRYACELTADFHSRDGRLIEANRAYLRGEVEIGTQPLVFSAMKPHVDDIAWQLVEYAEQGGKFYLGPCLRALKQIKTGEKVLWGRIFPPMLQELAGRRRSADGWIIPSAALDACLYAVGLLAWMQVQPGPSLPFSFGRIALGRLPQPGEACLVEVKFLRQVDRYADFEFTLFGASGDVILSVNDYRIVYLV